MTPTAFDRFLARLRAEPDPAPPVRYGPYGGYSRLFERLDRVRARGGAVDEIGRSAGGEPIWAARVGDPAAPRGRVLYFANLHAQEWIGVEAALATFERAAERIAAGDPRYAGVEVTCVPTANPDGYRQVARDLAAGHPRFRRKNGRGVDLNRNFAEGFDPRALSALLLPRINAPGPRALSEPETAALDRLGERGFARALSFHSFGGYLFWPWATRRARTPDDARFSSLAAEMRSRQARPYKAGQLGRWSLLFRAGGLEIDHLYRKYGTLAFLMEVSRGGARLKQPKTWLDVFSWYNPADAVAEANNAADAALALIDTL